MSEGGKASSHGSSSLLCTKEHKDTKDSDMGVIQTPVAERPILDQVIIIPEIMSKILAKLDIRSLKQVRLVCKSWLREAQFHMEKRGIVFLHSDISLSRIRFQTFRIQDFLQIYDAKIPGLTQPFKSIHLAIGADSEQTSKDLIFYQLPILCPPLEIKEISSYQLPLKLVIPLIMQFSSSLESLQLRLAAYDPGCPPLIDPKKSLPRLRSLLVEILPDSNNQGIVNSGTNFLSALVSLVEASPNLEVCKSRSYCCGEMLDVASELLMQVSIRNVKTLVVPTYNLNAKGLNHFLSIPFGQLENLRVSIQTGPEFLWNEQAVLTTVEKSAHTLRILDLSDVWSEEGRNLGNLGFPVCPNVHDLTLESFPNSKNFLASYFPSLQVLKVLFVKECEDLWESLTPLPGLKTLRVGIFRPISFDLDLEAQDPKEWKFFQNFPGLERLAVPHELLTGCCMFKSTGKPEFSKLLDGVIHLELPGMCSSRGSGTFRDVEYSSIGILKGIQTIEMKNSFSPALNRVPLKDLPCLQVFAFPWGRRNDRVNLEELWEITSGVETVLITNCCSVPTKEYQQSINYLNAFFDSAPNAVCGCRNREQLPSLGFWETY